MSGGNLDISVAVEGSVPSLRPAAATERANERIASHGIKAARLYLAPHTRSGETARELRVLTTPTSVEWFDRAPQALFLEEGTVPHVIVPRNARALRWFGPSGQPIFARRVQHPGTDPDPWLEPAITDNVGVFEDVYAAEVEDEWERG